MKIKKTYTPINLKKRVLTINDEINPTEFEDEGYGLDTIVIKIPRYYWQTKGFNVPDYENNADYRTYKIEKYMIRNFFLEN